MNHMWSLLGAGKIYTAEEALTLLRNMSDFEDESTSESEIEGDSSGSSECTPEQQYQVRTNSNIQTLLPKETVNQNATKHALLADETATTSGEEHVASPPKVSKVKEISAKGQNAAPNLIVNQNATKCALLADETATTSGEKHVASTQKYLKSKKYLQRAKKLHQNWLLIRMPQNMHYWLMKQPPHQVRNMLLHLQQYLKSKKYLQRAKTLHQNWFEGSCQNYMDLKEYTPGAVFDEFFEDRMWTILSENTNKYVHAKLRKAKDKGDKDPIELLSEGADQNPCA